MRTTRTALAAALAAVLLTGCGSGDDGKRDDAGQGSDGGHATPRLSVPPAFDGGRGWDAEPGRVPSSAGTDPVVAAGGAVAYVEPSADGYVVRVRDAATGKVRWTSAAYRVPATDPDAPGSPGAPGLTAVRQGDRTYLAAWAVGERTDSALSHEKEAVRIGVYPLDASGDSVAPLHDVQIPVNTQEGSVQARDGGVGLLLSWRSAGDHRAVVDLGTGRVTRYDDPAGLIPDCDSAMCAGSAVVAVTPEGPVVGGESGGIRVPGGWSGEDIAPEGVETGRTFVDGEQNGTLVGVRDGMFVARWRAADSADGYVWSAHDLASGRLLAGTVCDDDGPDTPSVPVASPNGTRLGLGPVLFDVGAGTGRCLAAEGDRPGVTVTAVADDGTAYGTTGSGTGVVVPKGTGTPEALPGGTLVPAAALDKGALFVRRGDDEALRLSVRRTR
ncbi:hypothetical protein [Streptomyces ardesiacus]|uniref:PQQ-binding-like beta-propeller repeat protein n=1 Tax=Streptomyces ardesiacus TaxID=285564 RepID=A0ABW8HJG2_9ACTN|nr:hypothetical protein [Streptomyces ardesiacus]MCL7366271.1 hypothetical protein [Streptomyces ardesiacus]NEB58285.1 hypothetical protein [Streptomyces diastaticus]